MRRPLLALLTVGLLVSCQDGEIPTVPDRPSVGGAISDGSGSFDAGNSHFFWLAPMVSQPDASLFGTFDPSMQPTVRIVCWNDSDPEATCDPGTALAEFGVGSGLVVESDHYKVEFDTQAPDPALRTSSGEDFTTYRIQALTPPLERFGGPFVFGFADFQLGENGKEARNLDSEETIGLVDGRTLPIRFRLDEGALEEELKDHTAPADDPTGAEAFCQINCSVTVIDPDEPTLASLSDTATDDTLTAMLIPAGAVWTDETAVLVIDERLDDGDGQQDGELCLTSGEFPTEACFRYELSPDNSGGDDFFPDDTTRFVRFGICPEGQAVSSGTINPSWRLLKADEDNGDVVITRPEEVDVTDFLQCDVQTTASLWDGAGGQLAASALQWLVPPLDASDLWGGQLRDLSDLFWGEDVEMSRLAFPASAAEGDTLELTVELLAIHADSAPVPGREVTFTRTDGTGDLAGAPGFTVVGTGQNSVTLETDGSGLATVRWVITDGSNRLEATSSPDARPAAGEPDPVAFDVTGSLGGELLFGVNAFDDGLSQIDPATGSVTFIGELDQDPDSLTTPVAMAVHSDGTLYAWNNSDVTGPTGELLTVDPCTGDATNVDPQTPGQGELQALAMTPSDSLFGVESDLYFIDQSTGDRFQIGPIGLSLTVAGADIDGTGTMYGLELNGDPGAGGGRLITIDRGTGAGDVAATLSQDVGTVGSIVFGPGGTLIGSASGGPDGDILFDVDPATGDVTNVRQISGANFSPQGMGFAPAPTCIF